MKVLNLNLSLRDRKSAGARRVRVGRDLAHYLADCTDDELNFARRLLTQPPMGGASQQVIFKTAAATAATTAQVTFIGPLYGIPVSPLILCLFFCPTYASVTATSTVTTQMRRTDTPAVIANAINLAGTTATQNGPVVLIGYLPNPQTSAAAIASIPGGHGIDVQYADSSHTAVATGTATAPISLSAIGVA